MSEVGFSPQLVEKKVALDLEDAQAYLPRKPLVTYKRGQMISPHPESAAGLHLLTSGKVIVSQVGTDGVQILLDVLKEDEFFGEAGLLGIQPHGLQLEALENSMVMSWSAAEIEEFIGRNPRLGIALIQRLVERAMFYESRVASMAVEKTPQRIERCLLYLADKMGQERADGAIRLPALPHRLIAEYVGTSREIVTSHMVDLRRRGYVTYSRKWIDVRAPELRERLRAATLASTDTNPS